MIQPLETTATARAVGRTHRDPTCYEIADKVNEIIPALNKLLAIHDAALSYANGHPHPTSDASKAPGLRPVHIEDGQVKEAPVAHVPCGSWSALGWPIPSVPEAEPPEQDTLWEQIADYIRIVAYKGFMAGYESAQVPVSVPREIQASMYTNSGFDAETVRQYHPAFAAAHRAYAQPASFTQVDVDLLKAMPDSGDWQHAEGYGGINDGAWFRSLVERLQTCVSAARPGMRG